MYEQTWSDNWLDELDGEDDDALRESLENDKRSFAEGGRTKGSSGSDVVVSGTCMMCCPYSTKFLKWSLTYLKIANVVLGLLVL